jgi:hypothetical protein
MIDGDRTTRWRSGRKAIAPSWTWIGTERSVHGISCCSGHSSRISRAFSVAVLGDGAVWKELYRGGTAAARSWGVPIAQGCTLTFGFHPYVRLFGSERWRTMTLSLVDSRTQGLGVQGFWGRVQVQGSIFHG